jgi:crotonobetainyl-CoA:carnitine CoA-transferase CaiB-like acyl-CoA transferase
MADRPIPPPFRATLKIPHASDPTVEETVYLSRVCQGPKRTIRRDDGSVALMVPPYATWTIDTARMVFHQMDEIIDRASQFTLCGPRRALFKPRFSSTGRVVTERATKASARIYLVTMLDKYEAYLRLSADDLTAPMVAALQELSALPDFQVSQLYAPPTSTHGDTSVNQTLAQVHSAHRAARMVQEIYDADPAMGAALARMLQNVTRDLGLDDDDD